MHGLILWRPEAPGSIGEKRAGWGKEADMVGLRCRRRRSCGLPCYRTGEGLAPPLQICLLLGLRLGLLLYVLAGPVWRVESGSTLVLLSHHRGSVYLHYGSAVYTLAGTLALWNDCIFVTVLLESASQWWRYQGKHQSWMHCTSPWSSGTYIYIKKKIYIYMPWGKISAQVYEFPIIFLVSSFKIKDIKYSWNFGAGSVEIHHYIFSLRITKVKAKWYYSLAI